MQRPFAETFPRIKLSTLRLSDVWELEQAGHSDYAKHNQPLGWGFIGGAFWGARASNA